MAELADGSLVCRARREGRDQLVRLRPPDRSDAAGHGRCEVVDQPCVSLSAVAARRGPGRAESGLRASARPRPRRTAVFELGLGRPAPARRISSAPAVPAHAADVSVGRAFTAVDAGRSGPGSVLRPDQPGRADRWPRWSAAAGGLLPRRPHVVGRGRGSTRSSSSSPAADWPSPPSTTGAAAATAGPTGSACAGGGARPTSTTACNYALALGRAGLVDGDRMAIRGTSAGGLTALGALIRADCFAGAAAWYGVTDLEALVADTHDFESRYVDSLVGPWPAAADAYRARSPIHHPDRVSGEVLLLQGTDDPVVPADQSERFAARLVEQGVPCRLVLFEGESHGFRRAETIEAGLTAELDFYRSLFAAS